MIKSDHKRIQILDSFRFLAIISVMVFHFYPHWKKLYPSILNSKFQNINKALFVKYGYLGVEFFFIISGFVIFFTLTKSSNITVFFKKRLLRLVPTMIVCSLITASVVSLTNYTHIFPSFNTGLHGFVSGWLFIDPQFLNFIFKTEQFTYLDGAYWSLLVEIKFYVLAGIIYFINKEKFIRNWTIVSFLSILIEIVLRKFHFQNSESLDNVWRTVFFTDYNPYFTLGIFFYALYKKIDISKYLYFLLSLIILLLLNRLHDDINKVYLLVFIIAFFALIYYPSKLRFLENKVFMLIGRRSYSLYLLHQHIGLILILLLSSLTTNSAVLLIIPLLVIIFLTFCSLYIDKYIETFVNKAVKK